MKLILLPTLSLLLLSCQPKNTPTIAGKVDGQDVTMADIDQFITHQLYDLKQRAHVLRTAALDEYIKDQVLQKEAQLHHVSKEQFLLREIDNKINQASLHEFIKYSQFETRGLVTLEGGYRKVALNSAEGQQLVKEEFKAYLKQQLLDSIMKKHVVESFLEPPQSPPVDLAGLPISHFRGNLNSSVIVMSVSDFECDNCRLAHPSFRNIFEKYKTRVRFGFTPYSGHISLPALIAEAAKDQNKFWEIHDAIFENHPILPTDTAGYLKLAASLNIDTFKLKNQYRRNDLSETMERNTRYIREKQIYTTPTIIINGRMIADAFQPGQLEDAIENALGGK